MANIEDVAINVLMDAPECPSTVAEYAVLRAARELCKKSLCWRITTGLTYTEDATSYDIGSLVSSAPYSGTDHNPEYVDIISAVPTNGNGPLTAKTQAQLDKWKPTWRADFDTNPNYYINYTGVVTGEADGDGYIRLVPAPNHNSNQATITDMSKAAASLVTFSTTHSYAVGDRLQLLGFDVMAGYGEWFGLQNAEVTVMSVPETDEVTINVDTSGYTNTFLVDQVVASQTSKAIALDVRVALVPSRTATTLSNGLLRFHEDSIIAGALSYILRMPNTTWENQRMAARQEHKFTEGILLAESMGDDENTTGVHRTVGYGGI